jgi:hypothetical protein
MKVARIEQARSKAGPLAECLLAAFGYRDPEDEKTAIDVEACAFVLAETVHMIRRRVRQ